MKKTYTGYYKSARIWIEADQFMVSDHPWPEGVYEVAPAHDYYMDYDRYCVDTIDGTEHIRETDWVVYDAENFREIYRDEDFKKIFVEISCRL